MVLADGRLGLLDFGSVGRFDGSLRAALQRLLLAMDRGDPLGRATPCWRSCSGPTRSTRSGWNGTSAELMTLLPMLRRLPRRAERIASAAEHGRLSIHVRLFADQRDRRHLTGLLHQVLLTILAATAGIMAVLLLGTPGGPAVTATVSPYQLLGSTCWSSAPCWPCACWC
jgi:hypothetical protein